MSVPVTVDVVKLSPQYDNQVIVSLVGSPGDQGVPLTRQRRRLEQQLRGLSDDQWNAPSRCGSWSVKDVVVHLAGVNAFWHASVMAGLAGAPTRVLGGFDPAATPALMVNSVGSLAPEQVLDRFVSTNDALLGAVADLDDEQWSTLAESPAGHVSLRLVMQHALWDSWVHERDILLPLGLGAVAEPDELSSCLHYAAALSPALAIGLGQAPSGSFAVKATDPHLSFVLDIGSAVTLVHGDVDPQVPCLQGPALDLVEALSMRGPLPTSAPDEWRHLLSGLASAFATEVA